MSLRVAPGDDAARARAALVTHLKRARAVGRAGDLAVFERACLAEALLLGNLARAWQ